MIDKKKKKKKKKREFDDESQAELGVEEARDAQKVPIVGTGKLLALTLGSESLIQSNQNLQEALLGSSLTLS